MLIRQLEYLAALASERHFARAAAACRVSQPALSAGIRKLEAELEVPIVRRGNRFEGFTPEGERVLDWAHRILAERDGLRSDVGSMREGYTGRLRVGAVPSAVSALSLLAAPFAAEHPRVSLRFRELAPSDIYRGLAELELDVGVTYLSDPPEGADAGAAPGLTRRVPLYRERYVLLAAARGRFAGRERVGWAELAHVPLCLLTPDTWERGLLDEVLRRAGARPAVRVETGSVAGLYAHVRDSGDPGVLPHSWLRLWGAPPGMRVLPLVEPEVTTPVGLVVPALTPEPPLVGELVAFSRGFALQRGLDEALPISPRVPGPVREAGAAGWGPERRTEASN